MLFGEHINEFDGNTYLVTQIFHVMQIVIADVTEQKTILQIAGI